MKTLIKASCHDHEIYPRVDLRGCQLPFSYFRVMVAWNRNGRSGAIGSASIDGCVKIQTINYRSSDLYLSARAAGNAGEISKEGGAGLDRRSVSDPPDPKSTSNGCWIRLSEMSTTDSTVDPPPSRMEVLGVCKSFSGVLALREVSLRVAVGEVLAVIGENGAGKSTLMKIMAGIETPDAGELSLDGQAVSFGKPADAIAAGVALIHQELNLVDTLTVAGNIFLGREPHRYGWLSQRQLNQQARRYLQQVGLTIEPTTPLRELSLAGQQLVEIAKALSANARLVIMDEPTSSLSARETERLFEVVRQLRGEGVSLVYISHRLGEIQQLADRVEVLRDGRNVGGLERSEITHETMVSRMIGRELSQFFPHQSHRLGDVRLAVNNLVSPHAPDQSLSLQVRGGEVVALAGLVGSGRTELVETVFGVRKSLSGEVLIDGQPLRRGQVSYNLRRGVGLVSEDRKASGLLLEFSVRHNVTLAALRNAPWSPWIDRHWEARVTAEMIQRLNIRAATQSTAVTTLSGGNQQKVALAKLLLCQPAVLLLDEPTRGVDVGAKHEIYELIEGLAATNVAVLFVSSDLEEVLGMADRVLVFHQNAISGELTREQLSEQAVLRLAFGPNTKKQAAAQTLADPGKQAP